MFWFLGLAACGSGFKFEPTDTDTAPPPESAPLESSPDSAPIDSASTDTSAPPCEGGVRLVQSVKYPTSTEIYDLAAIPGGFALGLPGAGEVGTGLVESWTLDQGTSLDRAKNEPALTVTGDGPRQALGVQVWSTATGLCSQTYGEDYAGHWYCWPFEASDVVDKVADLSVPGETPGAFFGYGVGDVAFDAYPPGQLTSASGTDLWSGVCGDDADCESAAVIGDTIAAVDSNTGVVYAHSLASGELLWETDLGATEWAPSYIWAPHGVVFLVSVPSSETQTAVLDVRAGLISFDSFYTAGYAEGTTSTTDETIEVLTYYFEQEDGSQGGLQVWNTDNDSLYVSFAELLDLDPSAWDEPYVRLAAIPDRAGFYAFATRGGTWAGVVEVCSVSEQ